MTVVVRIRGTDKRIEVEDVVNFKMDTAHFWLKLKGDNYKIKNHRFRTYSFVETCGRIFAD